MRRVFFALAYTLGAVLITSAELILFNSPFKTIQHLNLTVAYFLLAIILYPNPYLLLPFLLCSMFLEQFTSLPFGAYTVCAFLPILTTLLVIRGVVTNRSGSAVFLMMFFSLCGFRFSLWLFQAAFLGWPSAPAWLNFIAGLFSYTIGNAIITTLLASAIFFVITRFSRRWNAKYIRL